MVRPEVFNKIWLSVHEPRRVTSAFVLIYSIFFLAGIFMLYLVPENQKTLPYFLRTLCSIMFMIGGLVGAPGAWTGKRWLESIGISFVIAACVLSFYNVVVLVYYKELALPVATVGYSIVSVISMLARRERIKGAPYALGRGPKTELQEAADSTILAEAIRKTENNRNKD